MIAKSNVTKENMHAAEPLAISGKIPCTSSISTPDLPVKDMQRRASQRGENSERSERGILNDIKNR